MLLLSSLPLFFFPGKAMPQTTRTRMSARGMLTKSRGQVSAVPEPSCCARPFTSSQRPEVPVSSRNLAGAAQRSGPAAVSASAEGLLEEAEASTRAEALLAQHHLAGSGEVGGTRVG